MKNEIYCVEIIIEEDSFKDSINRFHSHLEINNNEILLLIYNVPNNPRFKHVFHDFLKKIHYRNLGKYISIIDKNSFIENRIQKIEITSSNCIGFTSQMDSSNQDMIKLSLDEVFMYKSPSEEHIGKSAFYINDAGFDIISDNYTQLWSKNNDSFTYKKMKDIAPFHEIGNIRFTPKFNFQIKDSKREKESIIIKKPYFELIHDENISEIEILNTIKLINLISTFYSKNPIEFYNGYIFLKEYQIKIYKAIENRLTENKGTLFPVVRINNLDKLFSRIQIKKIDFSQLNKIEIMIQKFWQTNLVDIRSSILLNFAILEIAKDSNNGTEQFEIKDTSHKNDVIADFKEKILSLIDEKEKIIFEKKFEFIIPKLFIKPLKSPLEDYLTSIGLVVDDFYPKFKTIKNVRDSITHGSISTHSLDKLESVNAMLYRISICIILDYLKIENWKEIVDITNEKKR